jgi:putative transcriptional regulator
MEAGRKDAVEMISGSVVASKDPGKTMKAWREKLGIKQVHLAHALDISASVLSDYESGRRPSPGVQFVKKYVEALVGLDEAKGRMLSKLVTAEKDEAILSIGEFQGPVPAGAVLEAVRGRVVIGDEKPVRLYGYTLSGFDFYRIFGATSERALVFTNVGMGRSPLVAIRVSQLKPRMVVIHGPKEIDPLAVDLARREGILLALAGGVSEETLIGALRSLQAAPPRP